MQTPATPHPGGDGAGVVLRDAPPIPDATYEHLPRFLTDALSFFERPSQRAVLLLGSLPVLSGIISRGVEIPHRDGMMSPDVFVCIVAPAASGKGAMKWAKRLGLYTHERLSEAFEHDHTAWAALPAKERRGEPEPPRRLFYLPGNVSAARMVQVLDQTGGSAVMFEEEIDTLAGALKQDWGNFSDVLRKAFHHEPISIERKTERGYISRAGLSMVLSGTPAQMLQLIQSAENGLFSRYGFYYFEDYEGWLSHRPGIRIDERERFFDEASRWLDTLYQRLVARSNQRVRVRLLPEHWDEHDRFFDDQTRRLISQGLPQGLVANVRRAGLTAVRTAATLAVLRAYEAEVDFREVDTVHTSDEDVLAALYLSTTFLEHAARFYSLLENRPLVRAQPELRLYDALPEGEISVEAFEAAWRSIDVSRATAFRYRAALVEAGLLAETAQRGTYLKPPSGDALPAAAALT
jgi:hypothetical protein